MESGTESSIESDAEKERLTKEILSKPLEDRISVPENTSFPGVNMVAIDFLITSNGNLPGYKGKQRSSVGVTSAFQSEMEDKDGLLYELEVEILKNPLVGDMVAVGLEDLDQSITSEAPWLQDFIDETDAAFKRDKKDYRFGLGRWMNGYKFPDNQTEVYVNYDYREYAEKLCKLLESFENEGG